MPSGATLRPGACRALALALALLHFGCAHGGTAGAPSPSAHPLQAASPDRGSVDLKIPPSRLAYLPPAGAATEPPERRPDVREGSRRRAGPKAAETGMLVGLLAGAAIGALGTDGEERPVGVVLGAVLGTGAGYLVGIIHDAAHGDFRFPVPPLPETKREYPDP